ncbi:MAG: LamB/YcsF family protein [Gemmatimonadaceae bacterium]|nr:LamB/YcsF family protein [Gemmatimonadaceae bacterium]
MANASKQSRSVDLNADLGEGSGTGRLAGDKQLLSLVTSANIACGYHAGDVVSIRETVRAAADLGVTIGAHPSFPDRLGFGRREMKIADDELKRHIVMQIEILAEACETAGTKLRYVKPHGALYNLATRDLNTATLIAESIAGVDKSLVLLGLANNLMLEAARDAGISGAAEAFADRGYEADGTLVSRGQPGSLLENADDVAARAVKLVLERKLIARDGCELEIDADSLCTHGDGPNAYAILQRLREEMERAGINVAPFVN